MAHSWSTYTPTFETVTLPSGNTYYFADKEAREVIDALGNPMTFLGVTSTAITDGGSQNPITIDGDSVTVDNGDVVIYGEQEFIWVGPSATGRWYLLGDISVPTLGAFATVDTGYVTIQPAGSNASSAVTFSGGSTDNVLGEDTTFSASSTASSSAVSFTSHTMETVLTDDVTATTPAYAATTKYMQATASGTALSTEKLVTTTVPNVTAVGSASTWSFAPSNDGTSLVISGANSTAPTLGTAIGVATGATSSSGSGSSVAVGVSSQPTVALSVEDATATGRAAFVSAIGTSGTNNVTIDTATAGHTASVIKTLGTGTAAAQTISTTVSANSDDIVAAVDDIGTGTAAAQTFTGTSATHTVYPGTPS